jgi:hypothetical protein
MESTVYDGYCVHAPVIESPIVPELPSFLSLPRFVMATLIAAISQKKKNSLKA